MPRKKSTRQSSRSKKAEPDFADLEKAGKHFIMGAVELMIGAGFAMKGMKDLVEDEEGRRLIRDLPSKAASKAFGLLVEARDQMRERKKNGDGRKRSRKIEVE